MSDCCHEREMGMALARRAYAYQLLHAAFGAEPAPEGVRALCGPDARAVCEGLRSACEEDGAFEAVRCFDDVLEVMGRLDEEGEAALARALRSDYTRLFQIPGDAYVHPWESLYTGKESMVFQGSTADVRRFYHEAGFKLQAEKRFPDDHIAAMMDYMGRMGQRAYDAFADGDDAQARHLLEVQGRFSDSHLLGWVDAFADAVAKHDGRGFYAAFARLAAAWCRIDREWSRRIAEKLA